MLRTWRTMSDYDQQCFVNHLIDNGVKDSLDFVMFIEG